MKIVVADCVSSIGEISGGTRTEVGMTADEAGDQLKPHGKYAWLEQGPDGYPPTPELPESLVATTTTREDLRQEYLRLAHDTPGIDERFKVEMRLEDEYHAV